MLPFQRQTLQFIVVCWTAAHTEAQGQSYADRCYFEFRSQGWGQKQACFHVQGSTALEPHDRAPGRVAGLCSPAHYSSFATNRQRLRSSSLTNWGRAIGQVSERSPSSFLAGLARSWAGRTEKLLLLMPQLRFVSHWGDIPTVSRGRFQASVSQASPSDTVRVGTRALPSHCSTAPRAIGRPAAVEVPL